MSAIVSALTGALLTVSPLNYIKTDTAKLGKTDNIVIGFAGGALGGLTMEWIRPNANTVLYILAGVAGKIAFDRILFSS